VDTKHRSVLMEQQVADCDVLIPTVAKVDAALLAAAPRLRLIVQPAAGYQNIDTAAARCESLIPMIPVGAVQKEQGSSKWGRRKAAAGGWPG